MSYPEGASRATSRWEASPIERSTSVTTLRHGRGFFDLERSITTRLRAEECNAKVADCFVHADMDNKSMVLPAPGILVEAELSLIRARAQRLQQRWRDVAVGQALELMYHSGADMPEAEDR